MTNNIEKTFLSILLLLPLADATAQTNIANDTIQWNIEDVHNISADMHEGSGDRLVIFAGNRVEWNDAIGNVRFAFDISEAQGSWTDIDQTGMLTLGFQLESQPGMIIIKHDDDQYSIEIRMYMEENEPQVFLLKANTYSVL